MLWAGRHSSRHTGSRTNPYMSAAHTARQMARLSRGAEWQLQGATAILPCTECQVQDIMGERQAGVGLLPQVEVWTKFKSWLRCVHTLYTLECQTRHNWFMIQFDPGRDHLVLVWAAVRGEVSHLWGWFGPDVLGVKNRLLEQPFFGMSRNALYISSAIFGNVDKLPVNYQIEMSHMSHSITSE